MGEGRTAEVLRNLCYRVHQERPSRLFDELNRARLGIPSKSQALFGVINSTRPRLSIDGSTVEKLPSDAHQERPDDWSRPAGHGGVELDLSGSGRGLQQTMLLLSYMYANPGAVLLLDEPDAHLEALRQRQTYQLITEAARDSGSQIIAASHSEVVLGEAARKDTVVAFVGRPHRIDDRGSQVLKALSEIGFDHYLQAEQTGWVLYLEGPTDLRACMAFGRLGRMPASSVLQHPFVKYRRLEFAPRSARSHFQGLREAIPTLKGAALFDRMSTGESEADPLMHMTWRRREIENYLCSEATLMAYAAAIGTWSRPLDVLDRQEKMREAIEQVCSAMETLGRGSPWSPDAKVSDDFLTPLFRDFFERLRLPNMMNKKNFHELTHHRRSRSGG